MSIVFFDEKFLTEQKAQLSIRDRGFLFGDGIFTTMKVSEGRIENKSAHLGQFVTHCREIHLTPPIIKDEWLRELVVRNNALTGEWRLKVIVTGGCFPELHLAPRPYGHLLMTLDPLPQKKRGIYRLCIYPDAISKPTGKIKSLAYLDRLWIKDFARRRGFDDALILSEEGFLLETAFSNLFWRQDEALYIPDPSLSLFNGTTIQLIAELAASCQLIPHQTTFKLADIPTHAQLFICNSIRGIYPVHCVQERLFERDPIFEKHLQLSYQRRLVESSLDCHS